MFFTMELCTAVEAGKWFFALSITDGWRIFGPYDTELKSLIAAAEMRQSPNVCVFRTSDAAHYGTVQDVYKRVKELDDNVDLSKMMISEQSTGTKETKETKARVVRSGGMDLSGGDGVSLSRCSGSPKCGRSSEYIIESTGNSLRLHSLCPFCIDLGVSVRIGMHGQGIGSVFMLFGHSFCFLKHQQA